MHWQNGARSGAINKGEIDVQRLISGLLTNKYTTVSHEDSEDVKFNAPHHFAVEPSLEYRTSIGKQNEPISPLAIINFQEGPILECGVNGVANEDLINMVICRLEGFQKSEFACRENALAITKLEESLMWLRKRTNDREARGVEGTHVK